MRAAINTTACVPNSIQITEPYALASQRVSSDANAQPLATIVVMAAADRPSNNARTRARSPSRAARFSHTAGTMLVTKRPVLTMPGARGGRMRPGGQSAVSMPK